MSAIALRGNYQLEMPKSFVDVDKEEMEYVDGGGIVTLHLCGSTVAGLLAGGATAGAISLALAGIDAQIGAAIIFGTGGTGTIVAAAIMAMVAVAIPAIAGSIAGSAASAAVSGTRYSFGDHWFTPTFTVDL